MSNVSIAEKRVPQDGRINIKVGAKVIDLRVSTLPTAFGESIVMRILDERAYALVCPNLDFLVTTKLLLSIIALPDGVF